MCLECGKHHSETVWYLDKEKHRIRSLGSFRDIVAFNLNPLITAGLKLVRLKQPDYLNTKMNGISRRLLNWFARVLHGMQVLPNLETAHQIIEMANELALMPCLCRQVMEPDQPPVYRCLAMNIASRIYEKHQGTLDVKPITKTEAKELVSQWRRKGAWQSVGWLWDANVIWVCNCDENCVGHRAPEADWGTIPSFMVAAVGKLSACAGCRTCLDKCLHQAISFAVNGKVVVDQARCKGCGLCIETCENQVLAFESRQTVYDVRTKTIIHLGNRRVHLD